MNRLELIDRISYCRRELAVLELIKPDCTRCESHTNGNCEKHGPIPPEYISQGCDDWRFNDIPF